MPQLLKNCETNPSLSPVDAFRVALEAQRQDVCLLTPTATLAEHLRHSFARMGHFVRPDSVVTLSRFVKPLVADLPPATPALLDRLVARRLALAPPAGFRALAESPGLRRMLAGLIEEVSTAGCLPGTLAAARPGLEAQAFQQVYEAVASDVEARGYWLRARRLQAAAVRLKAAPPPWRSIYLTGFYAFTPAELAILEALGSAEIRLALPSWDGAAESIKTLSALGFEKLRNEPKRGLQDATLFNSSSELEEVEEIARRIVNLTGEGRPFREIGIVLRSEHPYAAILRTTLGRFGIPARFYFPRTFDAHPVYRYLTGFLQALLSGWDYELLLPLLRMRYSPLAGTAAADAADFELRRKLPARGLPEGIEPLAAWGAYEAWRGLRQPPSAWAGTLAGLKALIPVPAFTDQAPQEQVLEWRELLSALAAWDEALGATAAALDADSPLSLSEFTGHLIEVCPHIAISSRDQRRNVVHVLDVYEARQWDLPVVFVCGMTERSFPRYHSSHPILTDEDRLALRAFGITLRTSAERQREEAMLFETAASVAAEQLTLSYPRTNEKGEETLPSFFLPADVLPQRARPCRVPARWPRATLGAASIAANDLLAALKKLRARLSPTAIETYLQCPFQYFARHALKLKKPPLRPHERLDFLLQGNILHDTLAETEGSPLFVDEIFTRHFNEAVRENALPHGCLTERVRLELDANLRRFLESPPLLGAGTIAVENGFDLKLEDGIRITGKIDRVAQVPGRGLVVIDYKYSRRERVRARVRDHESGDLVQGGLYLWAAEKLFRQPAAGMLYCGLRGEVSWDGWHLPAFGWQDFGESADETRLREIVNTALEGSRTVAGRIAKGEIQAAPADRKKCDWCEYSDTCRVETQPAPAPLVRIAGGAE
ncbi:MAG: PD-(D/E)XK nuclease family protein [Bryobacterales bacterium]|nr:PD-(D/E)XK nuclease family protein [Bryobacterales bacterium]